jgi:uncharacterized protein (TIGR03790 family)
MMRPIVFLALIVAIALPARAELAPEEVGIIAMAASGQSCELAQHYADVRGVPKSQILLLHSKPGESVSREAWETEIQPAIRTWLREQGLEKRIRCLVTCWDVPLRIEQRSEQSALVVSRKSNLTRCRATLVAQLNDQIKTLEAIAPKAEAAEPAALEPEASANTLNAQFEAALQAAQDRAKAISADTERQQANVKIERAFTAAGGINNLLRAVAVSSEAGKLKPDVEKQIDMLRGQSLGLTEGLQSLVNLPDTAARDVQAINLAQKIGGLLGAIPYIDQQRDQLKKNETAASFDNELSLLEWPEYPILLFQPNLLHYRFDAVRAGQPTTLMVSRLEAPTFELSMKLADAAVAAEKAGLPGKVYLDARGIPFNAANDKRGSYGEYDQSLRDLAERLQQHCQLEVVLDNQPQMFQKGQCPDAALYCGWYSPSKYVDAFRWQPGAVGYHLAGVEADTLRKPGGTAWCGAMLEHGACATLGTVFETELASFPLPEDFFSLLLSGHYTLVETFYRTNPLNSWAMVLIGDPLYNPFRSKPALAEDQLPERLQQKPPVTP